MTTTTNRLRDLTANKTAILSWIESCATIEQIELLKGHIADLISDDRFPQQAKKDVRDARAMLLLKAYQKRKEIMSGK